MNVKQKIAYFRISNSFSKMVVFRKWVLDATITSENQSVKYYLLPIVAIIVKASRIKDC
jgi:hypothetical protein